MLSYFLLIYFSIPLCRFLLMYLSLSSNLIHPQTIDHLRADQEQQFLDFLTNNRQGRSLELDVGEVKYHIGRPPPPPPCH